MTAEVANEVENSGADHWVSMTDELMKIGIDLHLVDIFVVLFRDTSNLGNQ